MYQEITLKLILKNKEYTIPCQFKNLPNVSKKIYSELLFNPSHLYNVDSNVSDDIFQSFINYWIYDQEPNIRFENYYQYFLLSQEFNLMQDLLFTIKERWDECEQNLYILSNPSISDKTSIEQIVSEKLDEYVIKHGEALMNLNIQTLVNIFNNKNRKFTQHNKVYELIEQHFNRTKNENIFILIGSIDLNELSEKNLNDSIIKHGSRLGFLPNVNLSFFHNLSKTVEIQNIQLNEQKEINKKQEERIQNLEKLIIQQNEKLKEQNQINQELKISIDQNKQSFSVEIEKENSKLKELINKQNDRIKELSNIVNQNKEIVSKEISNENSKLKELINKQNEKIQNLEKKINDEFFVNKQKPSPELIKKQQPIQISYIKNKEFEGIINYIKNHSKNVYDEIDITSSSIYDDNKSYSPLNAIRYEDKNSEFCTKNVENSWICFDFKSRRIIPSSYTIRSYNCGPSSHHHKSWVVEGSNDNKNWQILNEQKDCPHLKGRNLVFTFPIENSMNKDYKLLRMRITGVNWVNTFRVNFNCIEFYGKII